MASNAVTARAAVTPDVKSLSALTPQIDIFSETDASEKTIKRLPAKGLGVGDLTGLETWPIGLGPQQLPLPLFSTEGVNC